MTRSGIALANIRSGQVKFGPFKRRSFQIQVTIAPIFHAVGAHQLCWPGLRFIFQHFIINCRWSRESLRVSATLGAATQVRNHLPFGAQAVIS